MKKTIIALMALAGVASAAKVTTEWEFDNSLNSTSGISATGTWVAGSGEGALTEATYGIDDTYGSYLTLDGKGYVTVGNTYWSTGDGKLQLGADDTSFTITTVVNFDSIASEMFLFGTSNNHDEGLAFILKDGKMALTAKSIKHHTLDMTALQANTWYTLSVSYDADTNIADFSVDGTSVGTLTIQGANGAAVGFDKAEAAGIGIGSGSSSQAQGLWSGKMASLSITTVPEPTTATLSLLALAGLAARRRRK